MPSETLRRHFPTKRNRRIARGQPFSLSFRTNRNKQKENHGRFRTIRHPTNHYTAQICRPVRTYVAQLLHKGEDKILKKVIEEAGEVLMASKDKDPSHLVYEVADLWFHTMILLTHHDLKAEDVLDELSRRQGLSGLAEKAARTES